MIRRSPAMLSAYFFRHLTIYISCGIIEKVEGGCPPCYFLLRRSLISIAYQIPVRISDKILAVFSIVSHTVLPPLLSWAWFPSPLDYIIT